MSYEKHCNSLQLCKLEMNLQFHHKAAKKRQKHTILLKMLWIFYTRTASGKTISSGEEEILMHLVLWNEWQCDKERWEAAVKHGPNDATHAPSHQESDHSLLARSIITKRDFLSSRQKQHVRLKVRVLWTQIHTHIHPHTHSCSQSQILPSVIMHS